MAATWKDTKVVNILSTLCSGDSVTTVQRKKRDGTSLTVSCPLSMALYNRYMRGVDKGDQLRGYYRFRLKSTKNYKYTAIAQGHSQSLSALLGRGVDCDLQVEEEGRSP